jgi:hypothetical protein
MIKASGMGGMVPTPRTAVPVVMLLGVLCIVPQVSSTSFPAMVATVERLSLAIHTGEALCCVQLN